jgi:hypothetical protein
MVVIRREALEHCVGYNVLHPDGHLGFVEFVLHDENGAVTGIGVACGLCVARFVVVPVEEIACVDPSFCRVTLFDTPQPGAYELAEVLSGHAHLAD